MLRPLLDNDPVKSDYLPVGQVVTDQVHFHTPGLGVGDDHLGDLKTRFPPGDCFGGGRVNVGDRFLVGRGVDQLEKPAAVLATHHATAYRRRENVPNGLAQMLDTAQALSVFRVDPVHAGIVAAGRLRFLLWDFRLIGRAGGAAAVAGVGVGAADVLAVVGEFATLEVDAAGDCGGRTAPVRANHAAHVGQALLHGQVTGAGRFRGVDQYGIAG